MVRVASWLHGDPGAPLRDDLNLILRKWAMKTQMLLCYIDGNAARFGDDDFTGEYVIPPSTPARQMYAGDDDTVLNRTAVGISKSGAASDFIWSFDFRSCGAQALLGVRGSRRSRSSPWASFSSGWWFLFSMPR